MLESLQTPPLSTAEVLIEFSWTKVVDALVRITVAYLLALPIGWDREAAARTAGLRTFPLVAVGSCGFVLLGSQIFSADPLARVLVGLMTGIGFIGGGAILKNKGIVSGTATAASIWITGAVGAAVAVNRFEIAAVLSLLTFFTLRWVKPLKEVVRKRSGAAPEGREVEEDEDVPEN